MLSLGSLRRLSSLGHPDLEDPILVPECKQHQASPLQLTSSWLCELTQTIIGQLRGKTLMKKMPL